MFLLCIKKSKWLLAGEVNLMPHGFYLSGVKMVGVDDQLVGA
jgi:hypothetical protein